ncbi:peptide-methionine (S)-S-oxide reductase MsrA [Oricola thermophila]
MGKMKTAMLTLALAASALGAAKAETRSLVVAGGCFWCVESDFDHMEGVVATTSGYAGGEMRNPTYRNHGKHREVVKVDYDDTKTDYRTLVGNFLRTIDVTDAGGQFCDRGHSYTTAIHAADEEEARIARELLAEAEKQLGQEVVTPVEGKVVFWEAEDYHQDYYLSQEKQLTRFGLVTRAEAYKGYREGCGRDQRVRELWGDQAFRGVVKEGM